MSNPPRKPDDGADLPSIFVRIDDADYKAMLGVPALAALMQRYDEQLADLTNHAAAIEKAREEVSLDDEHEVDDNPATSAAPEGVWVNSWIYVPNEPAEEV